MPTPSTLTSEVRGEGAFLRSSGKWLFLNLAPERYVFVHVVQRRTLRWGRKDTSDYMCVLSFHAIHVVHLNCTIWHKIEFVVISFGV